MRWRAWAITCALATAPAACAVVTGLDSLRGDAGRADATTPDAESDAGLDGDGDAATAAEPCPSLPGPAMVRLDAHHCIDSTEVTIQQYRAFWSSVDASAVPQLPACAWDTDFTPDGGMSSSSDPYPVAGLNWCQAYAYCAWAGKSLCGSFDDKPVAPAAFGNADASVWTSACSNFGAQPYPYGASYEPGACNLQVGPDAAPVAEVAAFPQCVGALPGVYDMVGNIKEWVNACEPSEAGPAFDLCLLAGAGVNLPLPDASAAATCSWTEPDPRSLARYTTGVRCCLTEP